MEIQIRKGVFETNSSSSHSVAMGSGDVVDMPFAEDTLRRGIVVARLGEFGWSWYRFYEAQNKVNYLFTQLTRGNLPAGAIGDQELTQELLEEHPRLEMMAKVIKEHTGCVLQFTRSDGYIDHQSVGMGLEAFENDDKLKKFLFGSDAYVQTGNDNDPPPFRILTDRGPEYFYPDRLATGSEDDVIVKFEFPSRGPGDLLTEFGGLLTREEFNSELYARVLEEAVAMSAFYEVIDSWDVFEQRSPAGTAAQTVNRLGMKMSPAFWGNYSFKQKERVWEQKLTVTAKVPPRLAADLSALGKTPGVLLELLPMLRSYEHTARWLPQATYMDAKQRAKAEREHKALGRKLDKLFDQAAKAGVLF